MTYLPDRARREYMYITRVIQLTACHAVETDKETEGKIRLLCEQSIKELLPHEIPKQRRLWGRVDRAIDVTIKQMVEKDKNIAGERVVLVVYSLLEILAERNLLILVHDSPLHRIVEWTLSEINPDNEITQHRLTKAQGEAARWLERLQQEGYFCAAYV